MAGNPRNGRPYRRLVDWLRAQHLPCWICGHEIGYGLVSDARGRGATERRTKPDAGGRISLDGVPLIAVRVDVEPNWHTQESNLPDRGS